MCHETIIDIGVHINVNSNPKIACKTLTCNNRSFSLLTIDAVNFFATTEQLQEIQTVIGDYLTTQPPDEPSVDPETLALAASEA